MSGTLVRHVGVLFRTDPALLLQIHGGLRKSGAKCVSGFSE